MHQEDRNNYLDKLQLNHQQTSSKKVIIVLGKGSSGKSAFVRTLVSKEDKPKVKVGSGVNSVTNTCTLYSLDPKYQPENHQIYILDTLGFESSNIQSLLYQYIELEILKNKYEVVAIALVIDIQIRFDRKELLKIYNEIKIVEQTKKNLMFCVLSKYDSLYENDDYKRLLDDAEHLFVSECSLAEAWANKIFWVSQTQLKDTKFQQKMQDESHPMHTIYKKQFEKLRFFLADNITNEKYQPYQKYYQEMLAFEKIIHQQFKKDLHLQKYSFQQKPVSLYFGVDKVTGKTFAVCFENVKKQIDQKTGVSFYLLKSISLFTALYDYYFSKNYEMIPSDRTQWEAEQNSRIQSTIREFQKSFILEHVSIQEGTGRVIIAKNERWFKVSERKLQQPDIINPLTLQSEKVDSIFLDKQEFETRDMETNRILRASEALINKIAVSDYRIEFQIDTPTNSAFEEFMSSMAFQYFHGKVI